MVVISKSILHQFAVIHNDVEDALDDWYRKTKKADWSSFQEIKKHLIPLILWEMTALFLILKGTNIVWLRWYILTDEHFIFVLLVHIVIMTILIVL